MVMLQNRVMLWWLCGAMLLLSQPVLAVTIKVQSDRNPVAMNESFRLTFEADGAVDGDPDFKGLEQAFEILHQSQGTTMQIVNGQVSQTRQWTVVLMPKRSGRLVVPQIPFGKDKSQSVVIGVTEAAAATSAATNSTLFIEVSAESAAGAGTAYVQSQVIYKARLYRAINVANARLSEPTISDTDAVIEKLGEDREFETTRDGRRYVVLERSYAIFPQQSGTLTIAPLTFEGQVVNRTRGMFDVFDQGGPIRRVRSAAVTLDVKGVPAGEDQQQWLPAREVKLIEEWPEGVDLTQAVTAGEPLTWTLTLIADGLTAAQLPTLTPAMPDGLKAYPDQAKQLNEKKQETLIGVRQEKIALIPTQAGEYRLPAIEVPWWNSKSGQREVVRLAPRTLRVAAAAQSNSVAEMPGSMPEGQSVAAVTPAAVVASSQSDNSWRIASALLGLGWLLTVIAWQVSRRAVDHKGESGPALQVVDFSAAKKMVRAACLGNDAHAAKEALLGWGGACWPTHPPGSLGKLAQRVSEPLRVEIIGLNQRLYSRSAVTGAAGWEGAMMWEAFERELSQQKLVPGSAEPVLAPMYI